jgi:hypothetical protein
MDVPAGVELEGVQALRRAEVEGFAPKVLRHGLSAVDLHPTNGVCRAAALGEPEERDEDDGAEVEEELVVELDRAEDVVAAGSRALWDEPLQAPASNDTAKG